MPATPELFTRNALDFAHNRNAPEPVRWLRFLGQVWPDPEDADCIVDNTATGATLRANGLEIIDELMTSSTRLYASERAMGDPAKRERIEAFAMIVGSVLEARTRAMIELNVGSDDLARIVDILPCMREPTVSQLHAGGGWAVKAAVPRRELPTLIPRLKEAGGSDVIVTTPEQIVP